MQAHFLTRVLFWWTLSSLGTLLLTPPSMAQSLTARSTPQTAALLELYTSEGCNSCPPADEWVNTLSKKGFGLDRVIPLGLHVDYWDNLGWPDRFAQAMFTQRQRDIATRHRARAIYTPQLVLQGQALNRWETFETEVQRINQARARADLSLTVTRQAAQELVVLAQATIPQEADQRQTQMHVVLYENRLVSQVKAGENSGRTLRHNYVVRQWLGPVEMPATGSARLEQTLALAKEWKTPDLGLVVFVQQPQSGAVLQALALPLGQ